ncbi:MAG TPA: response regulator transcription factor [Nitrospiria bacterium]|nr:response regulator transcription factor [Nitrospiria bacterium]
MRILVVEDERKVSNFLRQALEEERYAVDQAFDGEEGLNLAAACDYDLIVLDLMLPKKSGAQVLKELRLSKCRAPVMVLTAKDAVGEKVAVLDAGGDDYLTKPFSVEEFLARARALLRRGKPEAGELLRVADLTLNPATREVMRGGRRIELTNKEYALLEYLLRNQGRILSRSRIAEHVWNLNFDTETNVIDVYVAYLRQKIDKGETLKLIKTARGVGYLISADG